MDDFVSCQSRGTCGNVLIRFNLLLLTLLFLIVAKSVAAQVTFKDAIPTISQLRAEVQANPHFTPPSLLKFAVFVQGKRDEALQSEQSSQTLFSELKPCVLDSSIMTANSVRAFCLSAAISLGEKFSSIKPLANDLRSQTPADVIRLLP